jgi:thiol:disulfide interchange protein
VAVFAALGLGLALPFVAVAFIPPLRARLPKPGGWMRKLQRFLAIPMAATAVAALWLLYREAGAGAFLFGLFAVAALAACLFAAGRIQRSGGSKAWIPAALAIAVVLAAVVRIPIANGPLTVAESGASAWSEAAVRDQLAQGHPVFVYFTADWCLTCKVNEAAAIDRDSVHDAFKAAGVKVFAGDWTGGDPEITRFLESRGRAGVPLYLWYRPGAAQPEELPQVLTPATLISRAQARR